MLSNIHMHLQPRTFIIFTAFTVVAVVFALFAFTYRKATDIRIEQYREQLVVCSDIRTEDGCLEYDSCEPIYAPAVSDPNCPDCAAVTFASCQKVTTAVVDQQMVDEQQCTNTDGLWYTNKFGSFCLCEQAGLGKVFRPGLGCVDG